MIMIRCPKARRGNTVNVDKKNTVEAKTNYLMSVFFVVVHVVMCLLIDKGGSFLFACTMNNCLLSLIYNQHFSWYSITNIALVNSLGMF